MLSNTYTIRNFFQITARDWKKFRRCGKISDEGGLYYILRFKKNSEIKEFSKVFCERHSNASKKEFEVLKRNIFEDLRVGSKGFYNIPTEKEVVLFKCLEQSAICIIFSFTSLEAFCNLQIPDDFEYKKGARLAFVFLQFSSQTKKF